MTTRSACLVPRRLRAAASSSLQAATSGTACIRSAGRVRTNRPSGRSRLSHVKAPACSPPPTTARWRSGAVLRLMWFIKPAVILTLNYYSTCTIHCHLNVLDSNGCFGNGETDKWTCAATLSGHHTRPIYTCDWSVVIKMIFLSFIVNKIFMYFAVFKSIKSIKTINNFCCTLFIAMNNKSVLLSLLYGCLSWVPLNSEIGRFSAHV